ncbi:hypothetical protein A2331_03470 [Candidatus Falkowbacteria bacterium RIFOXYB2_FULL_34_18]|uniref:Cohesin domain-containing protein n=1 Tax=Candidatus Falkowbacteria bacterium RIFOXYD2_FULL_34_120 TaxID=1798007 RepID=A0A1F5TSI8_9BACT|nr:MAG: hypothetical protein A2331_03470 [Candidatus Falkowbacteria bacterium RIFOXYB2_FULL_34_18]OGF30118.1 MAG: hypothetical protein A2500_04980 [Candidatus Falkowbacteria bacterium RIFOXYC12_FULL_34_55]OGF37548.1 MAG: hypothetical protein A2466_01865 [Candidatus Falkowbacteria bacterium RIFOXYC2_FULL_34_220]OGF39304.1 MAG: hypothetical protein A2515_02280 [Candidatus Falkowbacteria bacterium RIFOXYD12_FULL_34_57]OGF41809.1 MAG: hypothetical protein A2531_05265 [Candidatus Falkowbacteria bact
MRKFFVRIFLLIFLYSACFSFFIFPVAAQESKATLFLSPASGNYTVNKSFVVKVMVNSGEGVGINAAEGVINYDPSYVLVSKLSNASSIFKLWTTDPTFSNSDGKITFGGGSPGAYKGSAGEIFNITFTAKKSGLANVTFSSGIVLAADGKGTNVFGGFGHGKYTISEGAASQEKPVTPTPPEEEKPKGLLPPTPEVSSETHPIEDVWYSNNEPEFSWKLLADLVGVSFEIDTEEKTESTAKIEGVLESYKFEPQDDGEFYFHIRYRNKFGWGQSSHRKLLIDATPPNPFFITVDNEGDPTNPTPKLKFKTNDKTSGIDYYEVVSGETRKKISVQDVEKGYYKTEPLVPREYTYTIAAVDKAGNAASSSATFIIEPLKAPIITSIPKVIINKDELIIRGTSFYPQINVELFIGKDEKSMKSFMTQTDNEGNWSYFHKEKLEKGDYEIWARLIDNRGAKSLDSTKYLLTVVSPGIIESFGWLIIVILLIIIIILILYILYQRNKYILEKRRIKQETEEMKSKLGKIFAALREEVDELIELADQRPGLSESERRVKEKLQESLDISEEFITKEVEDVEKEIKLKERKL